MNFSNATTEEKREVLNAIALNADRIAESIAANVGTDWTTQFFPATGNISSTKPNSNIAFNAFYFGQFNKLRKADISLHLVIAEAEHQLFSDPSLYRGPVDEIMTNR